MLAACAEPSASVAAVALCLPAFTAQAHTHPLITGRMSHRVVDQVGECAFDQLQIAVELQSSRWHAVQGDEGGRVAELELLHRIGDEVVQAETVAVQHLFGRLQRNQFEQLLRQTADLAALRQAACSTAPRRPGSGATSLASTSRWPCSAVSGVRRSCATLAIFSR